MTDPRILECARALREVATLDWDGNINAEECARAVILKWLEQPPSHDMLIAAAKTDGEWVGPFDGTHLILPEEMYPAVCEQARKEIGGDGRGSG